MTPTRVAGRRSKSALRQWILEELRVLRFDPATGRLLSNADLTKNEIRALHARQRAALLARSEAFVERWQTTALESFANGDEIDPELIEPRVIRVRTDHDAALFRYASLLWSVPVSQGFGRRTRFLVVDGQNDKLLGIFALGDPVYN